MNLYFVIHALGTIHLRRRQIFKKFDPYPPTVGSFLVLSVGKFGKFLTPPPLEYADVLTCHFFVRHTFSEMENFKFQFYVAY